MGVKHAVRLLPLAFVLAACGNYPTHGDPPADIVSASSGNLHLTARPGHAAAGTVIQLQLTVSGPADYEAGCVQTAHFWAVNAAGKQVWEEPVPAVMCMAIANRHLAAGETAQFSASWPTDQTLAAGKYSIHGLFLFTLPLGAGTRVRENLPPLTVEITHQ